MWNNVDIAGCQKWIVGTLLGTDLSQGGKIQPHHVQKNAVRYPTRLKNLDYTDYTNLLLGI